MKVELYEVDGVTRAKVHISEHEVCDRVATEQDLIDAADEMKEKIQSEPVPVEPYPEGP